MTTEPRFPIGTQFSTRGKFPKICKVIDIHQTYNVAGVLVKTRYVAIHAFAGQCVTDSNVGETTIAMGLMP